MPRVLQGYELQINNLLSKATNEYNYTFSQQLVGVKDQLRSVQSQLLNIRLAQSSV